MVLFQLETVLSGHFILKNINGRVIELDPSAALGANQVIVMDASPDMFVIGSAGFFPGQDLGLVGQYSFRTEGGRE